MDQLKNHTPKSIQLTRQQWNIMREDVNMRFPEEACGLVAGLAGRVLSVTPITNILHSRVSYRMDPHEQLEIFTMIEDNRWELTAIYHSHPNGPEQPSKTDIDQCYYPNAVYIIWYKNSTDWSCKGYSIQAGMVTSVPINIREYQ